MRIFQAPPATRRRLLRGGLLLWLGLRIGVFGLCLAPGGLSFAAFFAPATGVAVVFLAAALAPLDLRLTHERIFLANLGAGPGEAVIVTLLTAALVELGLGVTVTIARAHP